MPPASVQSTVARAVAAAESRTVNRRTVVVPDGPSTTPAEAALSVGRAVPPSSSAIVSATGSGFVAPCAFDAVPDTVRLLFGSSRSLSTAVTVTTPVLAVSPAAIASVLFALTAKSPASAPAPAANATVTVVARTDAGLIVAVTVAALFAPLSSTVVRDNTSFTFGVASSSWIVSVTSAGFV